MEFNSVFKGLSNLTTTRGIQQYTVVFLHYLIINLKLLCSIIIRTSFPTNRNHIHEAINSKLIRECHPVQVLYLLVLYVKTCVLNV